MEKDYFKDLVTYGTTTSYTTAPKMTKEDIDKMVAEVRKVTKEIEKGWEKLFNSEGFSMIKGDFCFYCTKALEVMAPIPFKYKDQFKLTHMLPPNVPIMLVSRKYMWAITEFDLREPYKYLRKD